MKESTHTLHQIRYSEGLSFIYLLKLKVLLQVYYICNEKSTIHYMMYGKTVYVCNIRYITYIPISCRYFFACLLKLKILIQ